MSTPRDWAASRMVLPSAISPRLPEGWNMTLCFLIMDFLLIERELRFSFRIPHSAIRIGLSPSIRTNIDAQPAVGFADHGPLDRFMASAGAEPHEFDKGRGPGPFRAGDGLRRTYLLYTSDAAD